VITGEVFLNKLTLFSKIHGKEIIIFY